MFVTRDTRQSWQLTWGVNALLAAASLTLLCGLVAYKWFPNAFSPIAAGGIVLAASGWWLCDLLQRRRRGASNPLPPTEEPEAPEPLSATDIARIRLIKTALVPIAFVFFAIASAPTAFMVSLAVLVSPVAAMVVIAVALLAALALILYLKREISKRLEQQYGYDVAGYVLRLVYWMYTLVWGGIGVFEAFQFFQGR